MNGMLKINAYQIAEEIDIRRFRKAFAANPEYSGPFELFYIAPGPRYLYLLGYGVVVFAGYEDVKMSEHIAFIQDFCKNPMKEKLSEEFTVHREGREDIFGYNEITLSRFDNEVLRIVMLNLGQSVALDYYSQVAEQLLEESNLFTEELEKTGRIRIPAKKLLKFIGKTLNTRNRIIDNLYILDSPDITWEDEYLNKIDTALRRIFDIRLRFHNIDDQLKIVKENLDLFKDLLQNKRSNLLEWIIIVLILVEVLNLVVEKVF